MNEKLTVIIPNYNKERYVKQCVESVLCQTYSPIDIIVVDDKSTDNSREILKELAGINANVKLILLDENAGVSNARNVGLKEAESDYVTFLDSDDFYSDNRKIEREMKLLTEAKNPDRAISFSVIRYADEDGRFLSNNLKVKNLIYGYGKRPLADLLTFKKASIGPRDYCISKKLLNEVGAYCFDKNLFEDLDLLMRLAVAKVSFLCTKNWGTAYRQNTGGLSAAKREEQQEVFDSIIDKYSKMATFGDRVSMIFTKLFIGSFELLSVIKGKLRK